MSYTQIFRGSLRFTNAHCLEAGLDQFVAVEDRIVDVDDLKFDGLLVKVDVDTSAPASMWDPTLAALAELASFASTGYISTEFHLDGVSREPIHPGNRTTTDGLPPRHYRWDILLAADKGDASALRELQSLGLDLHITFDHYRHYSPLHLAARAGGDEAVALLLAAGIPADVAPNETGATPLSLAKTGEVARRLIAAGAATNRGANGEPPIVHAARNGRDDVVHALLAAGVTILEAEREDVVVGCCRHAKLEALLSLVKHDAAIAPVLATPAAMSAAIRGGEPVVVDLLLSHGGVLPETLLLDAINASAPALIEMALRASDALARCGDSSHHDDAMVRAAKRTVATMEILARHGVPIHPVTPGKTSPIHTALATYREDIVACVDWLFARGVPRDAVTADGETLMQAAWSTTKAHLVNAHGFDPATIDRTEMAAEDVERLDRLLAAGARARAAEERKAAAASRKAEREAAKAAKAAEKAQKAEFAAVKKARREAEKAEKAAARAGSRKR
jgi:hypothetical protein